MLAELNDSSSPTSLPATAKRVGSQAAAMTAAEQCSEVAGVATKTAQVSIAMAGQMYAFQLAQVLECTTSSED